MKSFKKIPTFKDEDAEREFWSNTDSTEYVDWSKAEKLVLPNFRPTLPHAAGDPADERPIR
jgi:hypothetical protein